MMDLTEHLSMLKNKKLNLHIVKKILDYVVQLIKHQPLVNSNYILYAHDDMYFCKNWDVFLENEIKKFPNNLYYLSGTNISVDNGLINYDCGSTLKILMKNLTNFVLMIIVKIYKDSLGTTFNS